MALRTTDRSGKGFGSNKVFRGRPLPFYSSVRTGGASNFIPIVLGNLVLNLDAGNPSSYPGSGTTWTDLSGTGNNGTLQSGPTYVSSSGGYFSFDGINDYVSTTTQFNNPSSYTIMVWFRTSSSNARKLIGFELNQTGNSSFNYDRMMYVGSDGKLYFGQFDGTVDTAVSTMTVNDNVWRCAAGTYGGEGTTLRLYVNGESNSTTISNNAEVYSGYWRVGGYRGQAWTNTSDGFFLGNIAQVLIYHRALTAAEIRQNFNAFRERYGI